MALNSTFPYLLVHHFFLRPIARCFDSTFSKLLCPPPASLLRGALCDLTYTKAELIAENALLRHQLAILHRQVKRPVLHRRERFSLLLLASRVRTWRDALLIIQPDTLLHWHRTGFRLFWRFKSKSRPAQNRLAPETVALIQQMARENRTWGAERIRGELLKLGIHVAKRTIQKYIHAARSPHAPSQSWRTFLSNHAHETWACDFLPVVDLLFRQTFVFFLIELRSRRVVHFGITRAPTSEWVAQHLREATPDGTGPRYLIRDNDAKYGMLFDRVADGSGIEIVRTPYRAPRANAICERFVGSVRRECLDQLLIFSDAQLYRVIKEYVGYFNRARPHQGMKQQFPERIENAHVEASTPNKIIPFPGLKAKEREGRSSTPPESEANRSEEQGKIIAFPILNGLHHDYRRVA